MKNNPTTVDDKVTERETKEQIVESSLHHSNKKNDSTPTENNKTKNETIVGDSIVQNVPSHSLNKSLKRIFQGCKIVVQQHKIWKAISDQPLQGNQTWLFFTMGQKSNQNPLDIADQIISFANSIKRSETEVSILSLVPCGDWLSEKGKKVNKELKERCAA